LFHLPCRVRWSPAITLIALLLLPDPARAAETPPSQADHRAEIEAAWQAANKVSTSGPACIPLLDQAQLQLPAGDTFIPKAEAGGLLRAYGNQIDPSLVGAVVGTVQGSNCLVIVRFIKDGYVQDDDAKDWQADTLLQKLRDGTDSANKDRIVRGYPALDILGWIQPPRYDATTHRLVWSLSLRNRGAPADQPQAVNYNTYALGRDGYFSLNLLTNAANIEAHKPIAHSLLAGLAYGRGKRYEDFDGSTDKVAGYGLAALVGVVAVKKLGLLAGLGVFLVKAWKLGLLAIAGVGAAIRRFFKRSSPAGKWDQ